MQTISGKIIGMNLSPKGAYESLLVEAEGKTVQVNLPKDSEAAKTYKIGKKCEISVKKMKGDKPSAHPVYDLADAANEQAQSGTVKSINYARHGEPNGVILDSGVFVHLKPDGMKAAKLKAGDEISFEGKSTTSPEGYTVVEASKINGKPLKPKK